MQVDQHGHAYRCQVPVVRRFTKVLSDLGRDTNQVIVEVGGARFEDQYVDWDRGVSEARYLHERGVPYLSGPQKALRRRPIQQSRNR